MLTHSPQNKEHKDESDISALLNKIMLYTAFTKMVVEQKPSAFDHPVIEEDLKGLFGARMYTALRDTYRAQLSKEQPEEQHAREEKPAEGSAEM